MTPREKSIATASKTIRKQHPNMTSEEVLATAMTWLNGREAAAAIERATPHQKLVMWELWQQHLKDFVGPPLPPKPEPTKTKRSIFDPPPKSIMDISTEPTPFVTLGRQATLLDLMNVDHQQ